MQLPIGFCAAALLLIPRMVTEGLTLLACTVFSAALIWVLVLFWLNRRGTEPL